jgi:hypothetical protein
VKLRRWLALAAHVYVRLEDGRRIPAMFDSRQIGQERLSSVQYVKFFTQGQVPVAIGCDHPELIAETALTDEQRRALAEDLD